MCRATTTIAAPSGAGGAKQYRGGPSPPVRYPSSMTALWGTSENSTSSSTLAIWAKGVRGTHQPSAGNDARASGACALPQSWQVSSQCSEMDHSPRPVAPPCGVPFGHASAPPPRAARRRRVRSSKASGTFFGSAAHTEPKKVFRALMYPLADALCGAPKWLKSSSTSLGE
jgi:hypothetical protein